MTSLATQDSRRLSFAKEPPLPPIPRESAVKSEVPSVPESTIPNTGDEIPSVSGKLTNVEAQRIMTVIQEIQRKVQMVGLLPDVIDKRVSSVFGGDTFSLIKEHRQLELKFKNLLDQKTQSGLDVSFEIKDTSKMLRASTRSLTRHFVQAPAALNKLKYLKSTKIPTVAQFEHFLQEIKLLMFERLKTTVEEEKAKQEQLSVIIAKEQKTSNEVKTLKEELEAAKKERMHEINKKNEVIRKLKEELRDIKQQAEDTTKKLESRSKQKEDSELQQYQDKEAALQSEIKSLSSTLADISLANREEEATYRKRKFKIESEVENWISKYDQDMDEKQAEIDDITGLFEEEKNQLSQLQKKYDELKKHYDVIMEERRIAENIRKEKEELFARMSAAVVKIQALFRGWQIRRILAKGKTLIGNHLESQDKKKDKKKK